jgi:hypothetical protein
VVPVLGLRLPQVAPPLVAKLTTSPATAPPTLVLTVAVTAEVVVPSAGTLIGLAATVVTLAVVGGGLVVWSMVEVVVLPVALSVAFTVQNPTVAELV